MRMVQWLLYGANGYTGELIAREAVRRGQHPILAGRSAAKVEALAKELGCEPRIFALDDPAKIAESLRGAVAVLHCAGPFSRTSAPMVEACLDGGVHYLDITGELEVFEAIMARDAEAKARGVSLLPGVGFDVVPTDCLAATLARRLPDAVELWLAFYSKGSELSRGTLKTMLEGIGDGGAIRRDGRIVRVPIAWDVREIPFSIGKRTAMTIPWGDVSTAYYTTGIPNIRVYSAASPKAIARARRMARFAPLLALTPVKRLAQKYADRRTGPGEEKRAAGRMYLWGRAANADGAEVTMTMTTPEGYAFTVLSALAAVEHVVSSPPKPGSYTPALYFGADFVSNIGGMEN